MTDSELINYITEGKRNALPIALTSWFLSCRRFKDFADLNQDKIRRKIRKSQMDHKDKAEEKLKDLILELEIAYLLLLDDRFEVDYEKYGTGKTRNPDFAIKFGESIEFNVEVTRIHQTDLENRFNKWLQGTVGRIRKVPSNLGFWIDVDMRDLNTSLVSRLEDSKEEVIRYIENIIRAEQSKLPCNSVHEYPISNFEGEIKLNLSNLSQTRLERTAYLGDSVPIFYKQKEWKFCYIIFEKLGQMMPGMINLLIVGSDRDSVEAEHLGEAINSINESLQINDESFFVKQKFQGRQDFLNQAKRLSGILFRGHWIGPGEAEDRNLLWCNDKADQPIPQIIREYLRRMDKPATRHSLLL